VVLALLELSSLSVDHGRMGPAVQILDQIEVGGAITDDGASCWEVVKELLALYPCTVRMGPEGIYLVPLAPPARTEECAHQLVESTSIGIEGAIESLDLEPPSRVELTWGIDQDSGGGAEVVAVLAVPEEDGALIAGAESALGLALDESGAPVQIDAPSIWDATSAHRAALAQLLAYPLEQERLTLTLPPELYTVELGQWVAIESARLGRTLVGQVIARRWAGDEQRWIISLLCDEAPDRDAPAAG
jgi:hypothetical protein